MAQSIGLTNKMDEQQIGEVRAAMCFNETYRSRFVKTNWDIGILGQLAIDHCFSSLPKLFLPLAIN
jgi:hypothetical protein